MRKFAYPIILLLAATFVLSACGKKDDSAQPEQQAQVQKVTKPTNPNDKAAWNKYLGQVLQQNMQGMTADRPFAYMVPAGEDDAAVQMRERQMGNVSDIVQRGILPGNLMALAGPDSSITADFMVKAFKQAQPGSLKGVIILFIGDQADKARVAAAVKPSDAEFRFVQM